jgi:Na+/H+-translocating membrane pyrophosphatase
MPGNIGSNVCMCCFEFISVVKSYRENYIRNYDDQSGSVLFDTCMWWCYSVGDPFKDTAGPSLHVLIKMLATITLVMAPLFLES